VRYSPLLLSASDDPAALLLPSMQRMMSEELLLAAAAVAAHSESSSGGLAMMASYSRQSSELQPVAREVEKSLFPTPQVQPALASGVPGPSQLWRLQSCAIPPPGALVGAEAAVSAYLQAELAD